VPLCKKLYEKKEYKITQLKCHGFDVGLAIFMKEKEATYPIRRRRHREERTPAEVK
jgi:hypothetical protein